MSDFHWTWKVIKVWTCWPSVVALWSGIRLLTLGSVASMLLVNDGWFQWCWGPFCLLPFWAIFYFLTFARFTPPCDLVTLELACKCVLNVFSMRYGPKMKQHELKTWDIIWHDLDSVSGGVQHDETPTLHLGQLKLTYAFWMKIRPIELCHILNMLQKEPGQKNLWCGNGIDVKWRSWTCF